MGVSSQIKLNPDGTGSIELEYRVALELEDLGKLDGNEKYAPVPVSRMDFERTIARIPGMRLRSYESKKDSRDMLHRAELSFNSPEALTAFFDSGGRTFKLDFKARKAAFTFPGTKTAEPVFKELIGDALGGYTFSLSFSVPGDAKVTWIDENGKKIYNILGKCLVKGQTVDFTVSMADLVLLNSSLTLEINW
jgi:hypothetical protein